MKKQFISILITLCMVLNLIPTTSQAALKNNGVKLKEGWYYLRCMGNYLNLDDNGNAELRNKTNTAEGNAKFYARFDGRLLLETEDGLYLGLDTKKTKNGLRVKAVERTSANMLSWDIYNEDKKSKDIWSLRPSMKIDYLLNASGQKNTDGTQIIVWESVDKGRCASYPIPDAPENGEIRFIPTTAPKGALATGTPKTPSDGWYSMRFDVDSENNIIDVIRTDLVELNSWSCAMQWTRAFYVENKGNNTITLRVADGRYIGTAPDKHYGYTVSAVKKPFLWKTNSYSLGVASSHRKYSLSPASDAKLVLSAHTAGFNLGDKLTVSQGVGGSNKTNIVFWELSGKDIPKTSGWTTKPSQSTKPYASSGIIAKPTNTKFMLGGSEVVLPAYSINSNNYVKLRDVAALLKTRFDVRWENGKANLYNHATYTKAGGELVAIGKDSKSATISSTDFVLGETGAAVSGLTAYNIGGNNYIKLRDIAKLFNFDVDWHDSKAWIEPDVSPYTED